MINEEHLILKEMTIEDMIDFIENEGHWTFELGNTYCFYCKLKSTYETNFSKIYQGETCREVLEKAVNFIKETKYVILGIDLSSKSTKSFK